MINGRFICKILGLLLVVEASFLLLCGGVSWYSGEDDFLPFMYATLLNGICGGALWALGWNAPRKFSARDSYLVVTATWILCSLGGVLPFYLGGYVPTLADGFFECMSGFTSTGFTVIEGIDQLPRALLFWRGLTQWIGGLGIVFFTIAVLPFFGVSGVHLFAAETTGPTKDKLHPRIGVTARRIWGLYVGLTVVETLFLVGGGMPVFDSIYHSFSTTATGGFSIHPDSIAHYDSPYAEYVISIFMFLSGINFIILFLFLRGKRKKLFQHSEFKWYLHSVTLCVLITFAILYLTSEKGIEEAFRKSLFQIISLHTSTGFITEDYSYWPSFIQFLFLFLMISGACSGSTSGGVKSIRIFILYRAIRNEFKRILHPNAVLPIRVNKHSLAPGVVLTCLIMVFLFLTLALISTFIYMQMGFTFKGSLSLVLSCMGSTGVALAEFGPAHTCSTLPEGGKWLASFLMLLGRLELFTVLLLFTPQFWRKR